MFIIVNNDKIIMSLIIAKTLTIFISFFKFFIFVNNCCLFKELFIHSIERLYNLLIFFSVKLISSISLII